MEYFFTSKIYTTNRFLIAFNSGNQKRAMVFEFEKVLHLKKILIFHVQKLFEYLNFYKY